MWEFLKHLFSNKRVGIDQIKENFKISDSLNHSRIDPVKGHDCVQQLETPIAFEDQDNFEFGFSHKSLSDFEILILHLRSYSGYIRENTLKQIQENYQAELFPYLLERLSDYVNVNRKLASEHIERWSQQASFSKLCIDYFYDVAALKYRERTDQDSLNLLLSEIARNKDYLSETLKSKQGKLPRVLLNFIIQYQWINESELIEMCRLAKDQKIREYWLNFIIQSHSEKELLNELKRSIYRDVQYRLFDHLYRLNVLNTDDLVYFWQSKFTSIMDYAYFALRQKKFDFDHYFFKHPIDRLTSSQVRIRAKQWILLKGDIYIFADILEQIHVPEISNKMILIALKQQYLKFENCLDYYQNNQQTFGFHYLSKLRQSTQEQITLSELERYLSLIDSPIKIKDRLNLVDGYSIWDQLYWFVISSKHIQSDNDKAIFDLHIAQHLHDLSYAIYGDQWTSLQKTEMQTLLPAFIQSYPHIFENEKIKSLIKPYLK